MKTRKIISGIVAGALVITLAVTPVSASTLSEQLAESNAKQAETQFKIDTTKNTMAEIEEQINLVNQEVDRINGVISTINTEIANLEVNIAKSEEELKIAQAKLKEQEEAMNDRVRAMYMYGNDSMLEFLFTSTDFSDFVTKLDMSRYIIESDKEAIDALEVTQKVIDEKKKSIEADRVQTVVKKEEQEVVLNDQENIKAQKDAYLVQNQAIVDEYQSVLDAEAATSASIEAEIQAYYAAQQAAQQAAKEAQEAAEASSGNDSSGDASESTGGSTGGSSETPDYSSGYMWPCGGRVTSPFGPRVHPVYGESSFHSGIDLGAYYGEAVAAAGNGTVISAGWNGGYGNCVIIDIGDGLVALYGHLSSINVSAGQSVSIGQTVGGVGSTGVSTGTHLHFEMRLNGSPVNPNNYF